MDIKYNPTPMSPIKARVKVVLVNILTDIGDVVKSIKEEYNISVGDILLIDDRYVDGCEIKSDTLQKLVQKGMKIKNACEYQRISKSYKNGFYQDIERHDLNRVPIIANINRISEELLESIYQVHNNAAVTFVILDPMVNSHEHGNYQQKYRLRYNVELSRGPYFKCIDKDVIYFLNKLRIRKNKILSTESLMVQYRNIEFEKSKYVCAPAFNDDNKVTVVPTVHYNNTTSTSLNRCGRYDNVSFYPGDKLHLLFPVILKDGDKYIGIPAGSKLEVIGINGINMNEFPYSMRVLCNVVTAESHAYKSVDLGMFDLPLNLSYYSFFFDSAMFSLSIGNNPFDIPYDVINPKEEANVEGLILVAPYTIIAPWQAKYRYHKHLSVYIQDSVSDMSVMCEETYFNNIIAVSDKLTVTYNSLFEDTIA